MQQVLLHTLLMEATVWREQNREPLGDNTYRINLKVVSTQTTTTTPPGSAATVLVTITAGSSSQPYVDGVVMCNEYTNTPLVDGDKINSVKITGKQDGPGKSDNVPSDAVIKNAAGEVVTGDYDITYVNGVLEGVPKLEKDVHFNYIMGYKDGTFRPNEKITRAATMAMINRVLDRHVENVNDLLPDMNVWKDNMDTSYTFYFDIQEATNFHECLRIDNGLNEKWTVKLKDIDWTEYEF